jgi:hypothetical protein
VDLQPGLQDGHQIQLLMDGQSAPGWNFDSTQGALTGLLRGSHTLIASVVDESGQVLCRSPTVVFHVRLPIAR